MILLGIASILLFFVTYFNGVFIKNVLEKWMGIPLAANPFETFVLGLVTAFVYFNLLSFILPVNYLSLLPLLLLSGWTFAQAKERQRFFVQGANALRVFASPAAFILLAAFLAVFFVYWIIPPVNWDSPGYHYTAIRWYEQYKVVPGLGNVHGRLAFNPASFIISAAWSFTGIAGQAIYPLNGVIILVFYAWMLKRVLSEPHPLVALALLLFSIFLFRLTLTNISSPSSDLLAGLLLFYGGWRMYELVRAGKNTFSDYFLSMTILLFAFTGKLFLLAALPVIPFVYLVVIRDGKKNRVLVKSLLPALLLFVPWLARNVLLSGYLLYPLSATAFLHVDWMVPAHVAKLDYIYARYSPHSPFAPTGSLVKLSEWQLLTAWVHHGMVISYPLSCFLFIAAMASPLLWISSAPARQRPFASVIGLWCIFYAGLLVWLFNSPVFRFGISYMLLCILVPLTAWLGRFPAPSNKWIRVKAAPVVVLICITCATYAVRIFADKRMYHFTLADCWLRPLKDQQYTWHNDQKSFPFVDLGKGVKLYLPDSTHDCLNASGPCMTWRYGLIEMRGNRVSDGFRNTRDEVIKYYPFVDE